LEVVESGNLEELGFRLRGLSITSPHKRIALAVAGATSPLAEWIGSANTLVRREGVWEAESTDPEGILVPIASRHLSERGRNAAVLGAGGAGRAAVVALREVGARVTLVNRGVERGRKVAAELGVSFLPAESWDPSRYPVVVHATPVGSQGEDELPFDPARLPTGALLIDLVYRRDEPTPLVSAARAAGATAVDGREVLFSQAMPQFQLMTGLDPDRDRARRLVGIEASS
jgi:shikimate dehydrogenase